MDADRPRILAIHAHPDDLEIQCAGALARLAALGCPVTMATMTPGDCGSADRDADSIAAIRRAEAAASAALIGADYACLEFRDLAIFDDDPGRRRVVEAIRAARPAIVLTAPPVDYLIDHEATSRLVRDACFAATLANYPTGADDPAPPLPHLPHLYFVDPLGGVDRDGRPVPPGLLVDVTATYDLKRRMLACHASQRDWLRRQHGVDEYLEALDRWSRSRGAEAGVEHAEGFRQYTGHPYPADDRLGGLLGRLAAP